VWERPLFRSDTLSCFERYADRYRYSKLVDTKSLPQHHRRPLRYFFIYNLISSAYEMQLLKEIGADACVSYKQPEEAVISEIVEKTDGKLHRAFDAPASNIKFSASLFKAVGDNGEQWFTSTNDWYVPCTR
jgi:hypothetical protein